MHVNKVPRRRPRPARPPRRRPRPRLWLVSPLAACLTAGAIAAARPDLKERQPVLPGKAQDGAARPAYRWLVRLIAASALVLLSWAAYLALTAAVWRTSSCGAVPQGGAR